MKNTRRFMLAVMALAMVSALAPMSAFADTTINPDPDNTPNPKPAQANTQVEFSVAPAYTVTIPAKVELVSTAPIADSYIGTGDITAENVRIEANQRIVVKMNSDFLLENEKKPDYQVPYRAYVHLGEGIADELEDDRIANGGKVAEFAASLDEQAESLAFTVPEGTEIQYAGKYSDTVTFDISVLTAK